MSRPRYLRVMMVLGDRDPDLRDWCYRNRKTRTQVMRDALRAVLVERGELPAGSGGTRSVPPTHKSTSVPKPAPTAGNTVKTPPAPRPATPAPDPPVNRRRPVEPPHDERSDLRAMLGDFS